MTINGVPVKILRESRNPQEIKWHENNVRLVVDSTGMPFAATVIEGTETHTRTATIKVNLDELDCAAGSSVIEVPITKAVIYGWYDNELGSYTNMLGDRTVSIAEQLV